MATVALEPDGAVLAAPAGRGKSASMARWAVGLLRWNCARCRVRTDQHSRLGHSGQNFELLFCSGPGCDISATRACKVTSCSSDPEQWLAEIGQLLRQIGQAGRPPPDRDSGWAG